MWRKRNPCTLLAEMQNDVATTAWSFLKKLKIALPYDLAIPLLGIYPKEMESGSQKDIYTPTFISASFTITKIWKQPKCPLMNKWIKKM